MDQTAWIVRPYPHGQYRIKEFLEQNIVAIGWPGVGDLSSARTRASIKKVLSNDHDYASPQALGQAAGNIYRFKEAMKEGSFVLVPDGDRVYVGQVVSAYAYEPSVDNSKDGYPHQRSVDWLHGKKAIKRKMLTGRVYDSLKGRQTVFTTYHEDVADIVQKTYLFRERSNVDLKRRYLERLQTGRLMSVNSNTFEDAVCSLFAMYFPGLRRLATTNSPEGDTDLQADLPGDVTVRIQVKHFFPERGEIKARVVDQLAKSMDPGDHGIVVTSGAISNDARRFAKQVQTNSINFIDGVKFVDYLFEAIEDLPDDALAVLGLSRDVDLI